MLINSNRFSYSRLSLQQRLSLLICAFLLTSIVLYGFLNYYSLKKATLTIGRSRVGTLISQISSMFGQSAQSFVKITHNTALQKSVILCLKSEGKTSRKETNDELDKLHKDTSSVSVVLLDKNLTPVLKSDKSTIDVKVDVKDVLAFTPVGKDSCKVGKIYNVKGSMFYPIIATVVDKNQIIGYIVCWQSLKTSPQAVAQFTQLMGSGASLYIVNNDGSLWTDMMKPVASLPFKINNNNWPIEYTDPKKGVMLANAQPIAYTNWLVVIGFSEKSILQSVSGFMNWIIVFGCILTAVGIFSAWIMSRNITKPLNQLKAAAIAISGGDYSSTAPINVNRNDELSDLANAFNIMAVNVQQTQEELERKVNERTAELTEEIKLRKISEKILMISRQRYQMLVDEVKDYAIIMLGTDGEILLWNKGAEKIKGYKEEEILGKSLSVFYTEEDIKSNKPQQLLALAAKDGRAEDEGWRVRKDGSKFWTDVIFTSIYNDDKQLVGFAKITRDISERKKLEEKQRVISAQLEDRVKEVAKRTLQLETANRELEAFSYSVSHDLRTPLRAINGYSAMLKEDYETKLDVEGNRIINNIMTNAKMMGQLIDDLLAFSRLGKKELVYSLVDMHTLTENVISELLQNESKHLHKITIGSLPPCEADPSLMKQVLLNLISNALKYSSKKSRPEIDIGYTDEETRVVYSIKDNGVGFDMAYADKLFGVFQRLHSQEEFEGSGVGLALVKRIIDKHNGKIWADAIENSGAAFYFSIPKKINNGQ